LVLKEQTVIGALIMIKSYKCALFYAVAFFVCSLAAAHHSTGPVYDRGQIVEVEGEITEMSWTNPHIRFAIDAVDARGERQNLEIETNSVSIVSRFGLTAELVNPGTRVKIAGNPTHAEGEGMWLTNMLLPNGQEILFGARYEARWSDKTIGEDIRGQVTADPNGELGIFRVWTSGGGAGGAFWPTDYPLTEAAAAARAKHDLVRNDPTANCVPKGLPYIMEQPYPMQIVDETGVITLRLEEYDSVRRVNMSADSIERPTDRLGHSVGRWDGDTLVINTTDIDYPFFNNLGIPQSAASEIEERFWLNDDGSRLNYEMTVTDPVNFTGPVTMTRFWVWRPGEEVRPYNCIP
jgi:hypothetical protein